MKIKVFLIIITLTMSGLSFGCKGDKTLRTLREKSAELSTYGRNLSKAFNDAFFSGTITKDELAMFGKADDQFFRAVNIYRAGVAAAEQAYKDTGKIPALGNLERLLDRDVMTAFFDLTSQIKGFPFANSETIQTILSSIRVILLTLKSAFGDARILAVENNNYV